VGVAGEESLQGDDPEPKSQRKAQRAELNQLHGRTGDAALGLDGSLGPFSSEGAAESVIHSPSSRELKGLAGREHQAEDAEPRRSKAAAQPEVEGKAQSAPHHRPA